MMKLAKDAFDLGVFVSDIQASLDFYQDTLGLKLEDKNDLPLGTMYRLKCGNSDFKLIDPQKVPPAGASGGRSAEHRTRPRSSRGGPSHEPIRTPSRARRLVRRRHPRGTPHDTRRHRAPRRRRRHRDTA